MASIFEQRSTTKLVDTVYQYSQLIGPLNRV